MSFPQVRAYPADLKPEDRTPDNLVVGWYLFYHKKHMLYIEGRNKNFIACFVYIDFTSAAIATGKKDKHEVEIYGSMGEMQGGDTIYCPESKRVLLVIWSTKSSAWYTQDAYDVSNKNWLRIWATETFEIIPQESDSN